MTEETPRLSREEIDKIRNEINWQEYHAGQDALIPQTEKDAAVYAFQETLKSLMETHPEISLGLQRMPVVVSNRTDAISTDNNELYISPSWWTTRSLPELRHCAAFTASLIIYDSINRGKAIPDVDNERWELACNLVINRALLDEGIAVLPAEGAFITSIHSQMTSEEVYGLLTGMTEEEITRAVWPLETHHLSN